jgi:uncharacterized membrane protein YjfL (UPF0719 family)
MTFETGGIYFLYTLIYIGFALGLKLVLNFKASAYYKADDMIAGGNLAVGLRRSGAQLGLAIAMMGVMAGSSTGSLTQDLVATATYGALATLFMVSSLMITDKLVLPGIKNMTALKENNIAVGAVEFGMLVATGIIAYSSIYGEGGGIVSSLAYFVIGQLTLVVLILAYEHLAHRGFKLMTAIGDNQVASGIYVGGKIIAYALILKSAIAGNTPDATLQVLALDFLMIALAGMILLYIFELIIDLLIITTTNVSSILSENKLVPVVQLTASKIGVALLLSNAIL